MRQLPPLGLRQRLVLADLVVPQDGRPLTAEAVGRFLHGRRWREHCGRDGFGCRTPSHHPASESCDFCFGEGADVLLALHRRGLVRVVQLAVIERGPE